ncbi:hypothetical protein Tco_0833908, partial [Tanacetum coccineum]
SLFKFEDRVKALEDDFLEFKKTNLFAEAVSSIPGIVDKYLANQMNEAVKAAVQLQSDRLREEAQAENEDFINKIDENIKKIIKDQVKVQVKEQVTKILPRIEKSVNEQLEAEVLIRLSNEAKTSHVVAANLSELELKKILIDKIENNKSIDRSVPQKNLYKALDDDEEPSAGSNRGSTRRRAGKEPKSTSAPKEKTSKSTGKSKEGSKSHQKSTDKFAQAEEPTYTVEDLEEPTHQEFNTGYNEDQPVDETTQFPYCNLARKEDPRESFNKLMDTPLDFSAFVLIRLKVDTLTPELLAGPTFELMKVNRESARDVYSRYRILDVTKLKIIDWHNYKHLDWIIVRRNEDKLYTFKEGDYNKLHLQDIEDILLLLIQGKLTNLNVEERLALGVTLRISDLKRKLAYTTYSNPRGFIYQNKDKKNRLMRIDELYKFSDGTLNDVRSALDDILKRIRMKYLPQTVWRNVDKERAGAMIQAIDQQLRNRRIIRSLEKFVGGRPGSQICCYSSLQRCLLRLRKSKRKRLGYQSDTLPANTERRSPQSATVTVVMTLSGLGILNADEVPLCLRPSLRLITRAQWSFR